MEDPTSNNSSPTDDGSKVVVDEGFRTTRISKCPWMMLRDSVCGTVTYDPDLRLRPEKKRKAEDVSSQHYLEYKTKIKIPIEQPQYSLSTSTVEPSIVPSSNYFESPEAL